MKIIVFLLSSLFFISDSFAQKKPAEDQKSHRIEKIINSQWTFNYFSETGADKGYEAPSFNDSRWQAISIPHTWSTYETTGDLHPFIRNAAETDNPYWWTGWGWYRKHFSVNREYSGRKVFIKFEGVQKYCKVWINGKYLGDHKGGYGSFDFDITENIKPGEDNVLVVAVNNRQKEEFKIPPMAAGSFDVYGGIYRDVTLVLTDKLYIPMQGSALHEGGTFVTTPQVSDNEGVVRVQTWVKNDNTDKKTCTLQTSIADASDKIVQVVKSKVVIDPGQIYMFDQSFKPIKSPHLWSNDDPYLYKVKTELFDEKTLADDCTSPLGIRWFRWDFKENILYVNGKKMMIHGGNRHQEYPWLGAAIPKWINMMDINDMSVNLNYNFIRTANYPNDKSVYDLTDKYGMVADEEVPNTLNQEFSSEVQIQQLKEMIRRDRNHPSIMFWSMGNETSHPVDSKIAVAEDTTRILTGSKVTDGSAGKFVRHTDQNLIADDLPRCTIRGWYNKDVKNLEPSDGQQSGTEQHQLNMLKASEKYGNDNLCTWVYADYGADRDYLNSPLSHISPQGYVDAYRVPKYGYYFWQANYSKIPMVFIQPHFWRSQYLGLYKDIIVSSNCDKVELIVNGVSKGYKLLDKANFHSVTFNSIPVEAGTISALATKDGKTIKTEIMMAGRPAKIVLTGSHNKIIADRSSVVIIKADIVDLLGNHVYGANNTLKWTISGPATLVGPMAYESDMNKRQALDGVWYIDTPVSNLIRSTGKSGKIHVSVSSSGLTSGSVDIDAEDMVSDNSVVSEPVLQNEGRIHVTMALFKADRKDDVPHEIKAGSDELNFGTKDISGYKQTIKEYIIKNNPSVDTTTVEFRTLISLFALQLLNSNGHMIADDYNYNIDHFNNCRLISGYVNSTKLPQPFKDGLKKYYSEVIIDKGNQKDAGEEMNWLNWIPSGGTVVVVQDEKPNPPIKGIIYTKNTGLSDIISAVYPQFTGFSQEAKERDLVFISRANPFIHVTTENGQSVSYTAEKGKPILIPLLKFISE